MQFIQQRTTHDCGVAALAMFTDHTYEEMMKLCLEPSGDHEGALPIYREGWGMNKEHIVLQRLGLWDYHNQNGRDDGKHSVMKYSKPDSIDARYFRNLAWGRRSMMFVPSLNLKGGFHLLCYNGHRVLDPNNGREGKKFYTKLDELEPLEIYVMRN